MNIVGTGTLCTHRGPEAEHGKTDLGIVGPFSEGTDPRLLRPARRSQGMSLL